MQLILYSKPGCHLCEGLQEKLEQIHSILLELEIRDITTRDDWFQQYQYEIPVLFWVKKTPLLNLSYGETLSEQHSTLFSITRPSPRATIAQLEQMLQKLLLDPAQ
ncbi:glutaredoxin family protein [Phormidium sp. CLA17]|uniref:glutaredoxin family protein n=1 Tax=Leptolyngbya sp. Cla-17 TaxID=2803751 RepID=UPI001491892F|nr:glutaredoxin family protein [Leptolyngbya sp. Cla-17]MBM0741336.1 glutaredoxin family protein [Leptolyngbya sp. Cla-17]